MATPRNINYSISYYDPSDGAQADVLRFLEQLGGNAYATNIKFAQKGTFNAIVEKIYSELDPSGKAGILLPRSARYTYHGSNHATVYLTEGGRDVLYVRIDDHYRQAHPADFVNREFYITMHGERSKVEDLFEKLKPFTQQAKLPRVTWHYKSDGRNTYKPILVDKPKEALDEFYPFIKQGVKQYLDDYAKSEANIMIFLGEPGTGKTSLIRNYIYEHRLNTFVTYDEAMLHSDSFFVNYLTDDDADLLVVEDADLLLTDRENDGNKVMSKLLNVSDGLIKVMDKKIIFTANFQQATRIDSALMRPGRCFDVVTFRALTYPEAVAAAEAAGIPGPKEVRDYTIAELFNQEDGSLDNTPKSKFGFI